MKKKHVYVLMACALLALGMLIYQCGSSGGGDSTSTSATTTVSSSVNAFPSSVGVDVSTVASSDLQSVDFKSLRSKKSVAKSGIPSSGTMSAPITAATNLADIVTKLSDNLFSGIATALNSQLSATSTQVSGTAFGGTLKIDFTNYNADIDGDGQNDPCSGTASVTSTQHSCFRAWYNNQRLMIGYVQTVPTSTSSGKGIAIVSPTLVANSAETASIGLGSDVMTYLAWNNTEASSNSFNGYMTGQMQTGVTLTVGRIVAASDTTSSKITLQTAAYFSTPQSVVIPNLGATSVDHVLFNSQFFLTGTHLLFENDFFFQGAEVAAAPNNTWFCGVIATGDPASQNPATLTKCTDEGLSTEGIAYPSLAESDASKTQFPSTTVFPEQAGF